MLNTKKEVHSTGIHLVVSGRPDFVGGGLELASSIAEIEANGVLVPVVVFRLDTWTSSGTAPAEGSELSGLDEALRWVVDHGRVAVVQTARIIPRAWVRHLQAQGVIVDLCLAHRDLSVQRALLGPGADSVADLLLQAQHLASAGLTVTARIAPIVAGVHDLPGGFAPLLRSVCAADVEHIQLAMGALDARRIAALRRALDLRDLVSVARAYRISLDSQPVSSAAGEDGGGLWRLDRRASHALLHGFRQLVEAAGLRLFDHASGATQLSSESPSPRATRAELASASTGPRRADREVDAGCTSRTGPPGYQSVLTGELFPPTLLGGAGPGATPSRGGSRAVTRRRAPRARSLATGQRSLQLDLLTEDARATVAQKGP